MPMNPRLLRPRSAGVAGDSDVVNYIGAVEAADGQQLEQAVKDAIRDFILGCKTDNIWSAIKASCILMGARTLSGALTPLVGTAPTNINFVSGDYARKNGIIGNGTTKSIDTGRNNNADPQDSFHLSAYVSAIGTGYVIGDVFTTGWSAIFRSATNHGVAIRRSAGVLTATAAAGFLGGSRASSAAFTGRLNGATSTSSVASQAITQNRLRVLASSAGAGGSPGEYGTSRVAFYSIGESLDLALLDSRVTTLYNAIGAAIP